LSINCGKRSIRGSEKKEKEGKGRGMEVEVVEEREKRELFWGGGINLAETLSILPA